MKLVKLSVKEIAKLITCPFFVSHKQHYRKLHDREVNRLMKFIENKEDIIKCASEVPLQTEFIEEDIRIIVQGKADIVCEAKDKLIIGEAKSHNDILESDIIQLKLYMLMLMRTDPRHVSQYVGIINAGGNLKYVSLNPSDSVRLITLIYKVAHAKLKYKGKIPFIKPGEQCLFCHNTKCLLNPANLVYSFRRYNSYNS